MVFERQNSIFKHIFWLCVWCNDEKPIRFLLISERIERWKRRKQKMMKFMYRTYLCVVLWCFCYVFSRLKKVQLHSMHEYSTALAKDSSSEPTNFVLHWRHTYTHKRSYTSIQVNLSHDISTRFVYLTDN